jgi:adenine-specific DNA-methyltransferase
MEEKHVANLSKIKRERMLDFLESLKAEHTDDKSIRAFTEIENQLRDKKYGLVWEEHTEHVDEMLEENIPIFTEDKDKEIITSTGGVYNFLLEGDNLQSLYLLQKTHRGNIDLIYIDPPYNTGNEDFIYDDNFISTDDGYRHSMWLSFMNERLRLAYNLLSESGMIMISIDDNELAQLKLLCDEIFEESNLISIHNIQVRYAQKSLADGKPVKPVMEYVLIYAKNASKTILNLPEEDYTDEKFVFEIKELTEGETIQSSDGSEMVVFKPGQWSIEEKEPSIALLKETWISGTIYTKMSYGQVVRKYVEPRYQTDGTGCLYKIMGRGEDGRGYRYYVGPQRANSTRCKMYSGMPLERVEEVKAGLAKRKVPLSNFYDYAADFGNIVNEGAVTLTVEKSR